MCPKKLKLWTKITIEGLCLWAHTMHGLFLQACVSNVSQERLKRATLQCCLHVVAPGSLSMGPFIKSNLRGPWTEHTGKFYNLFVLYQGCRQTHWYMPISGNEKRVINFLWFQNWVFSNKINLPSLVSCWCHFYQRKPAARTEAIECWIAFLRIYCPIYALENLNCKRSDICLWHGLIWDCSFQKFIRIP